MPYRGSQPFRQAAQTTEIMRYAGFTATWRQYISASAGVSVAGFGSAINYREQTITALLGGQMGSIVNPNTQRQTPMGQVEAGELNIHTPVYMTDKDEFMWGGVRYRVDANSQPSRLDGMWYSKLTRGDN